MTAYPADLVEAAIAGDRDAISALLAVAQPDIRRYARRTCRSTSDIEDAVQETMIIVYRRLKMLREVAALSSWIFRIVHRTCLSLATAMAEVPVEVGEIDREIRIQDRAPQDLRLDVANAIQSLPAGYRDVILLRDIEERTIDEIAARLRLTREAVKGRLHRARAFVREYLLR